MTQSSCGAVVGQNCSYVTNPGYPAAYTAGTEPCFFRVNKCAQNICHIKLEYETFSIAGPVFDAVSRGQCTQDSFMITSGLVQPSGNPPLICGENTGQHVYLDAGFQSSGGPLQFDFNFNGNFDRYVDPIIITNRENCFLFQANFSCVIFRQDKDNVFTNLILFCSSFLVFCTFFFTFLH